MPDKKEFLGEVLLFTSVLSYDIWGQKQDDILAYVAYEHHSRMSLLFSGLHYITIRYKKKMASRHLLFYADKEGFIPRFKNHGDFSNGIKENIFVKNCTSKSISFTPEGKMKAVEMHTPGVNAKDVFKIMGLPQYFYKTNLPKKCLGRWKKIIKNHGTEGLMQDKRGTTKGPVKVDTSNMTMEEENKYLRAELAYTKKENKHLEVLKKNFPSKPEKFNIIYGLSGKHCVTTLCKVAHVSLSGYYAHRARLESGTAQVHRDKEDREIIEELARKGRFKRGYRMITMLLHNSGIKMNHKKVYRIMKTYNYLSTARKKNPYKHGMRATQEHTVKKNLLNREFRSGKPYQKLGTDITYLKLNGKNLYLSIVKDIISGETLSYYVSLDLSMNIVCETIKNLKTYKDSRNIDFTGSLIHSDQGFHYTHADYVSWVEELGFVHLMSRKGNCLDNSPTESFFGHLKDEIDISECQNVREVREYIDNYINYYNNIIPQWDKQKMTPVQYRNFLLTQ